MNKTKLTVAITGSGGFLGAHAVSHFSTLANVRVSRGELSDAKVAWDLVNGADLVLHLANRGFPSDVVKDPESIVEANLKATQSLMLAAGEAGIKRVVYASSGGAIYLPKKETSPLRETDPVGDRSAYATTKLRTEELLREWAEMTGMATASLRLSTAFGTGQAKLSRQGFIGALLQKILHQEPIEIWGSTAITKDFIYVKDVMTAFEQALFQPLPLTGEFNVGAGYGLTLSEVIETVTSVTGKLVAVKMLPQKVSDASWTVLDTQKFRWATGWGPQWTLRAAVTDMWQELISARHAA